jgi:hypothetical protein
MCFALNKVLDVFATFRSGISGRAVRPVLKSIVAQLIVHNLCRPHLIWRCLGKASQPLIKEDNEMTSYNSYSVYCTAHRTHICIDWQAIKSLSVGDYVAPEQFRLFPHLSCRKLRDGISEQYKGLIVSIKD